MKKILIVLLAVLLLSSCTETDIKTPPNPNEFRINGELPVLSKFEGNKNGGRFYEQFTDDFIPSDEYGEIIPFVGINRVFQDKNEADDSWRMEQSYSNYGFCTPDGKIVMDASDKNTYIFYNEADDGFGYYTLTQEVKQKEDAPDEYNSGKSFIIPISGKWAIEYEQQWSWVSSVGDGYIYLAEYSKEGSGDGKLKVYDYDGNYVKTLDDMDVMTGYSHGLMQVYIDSDNGLTAAFVNEDGEIVLGPYRGANQFNKDGVTVIRDEYDLSYLINTKGERLTKAYDNIIVNSGYNGKGYDVQYFSARHTENQKLHDIYTPKGEFVKTIEAASYYSSRFPDNGDMIYYYTDYDNGDGKTITNERMVWKRLSDGSDFVSREFGVMPNSYSGNDNCYVYIDEEKGGGYVFDGDGKTLANLPDMQEFYNGTNDGKYIIYRDGVPLNQIYDRPIDDNESETVLGKTHIYNTEKKQVVYTIDTTGSAGFIGKDNRYIQFVSYDYFSMFGGVSEYWLYDTAEEKIVFEKLKALVNFEIDGKLYFNACTQNSTTLYDENMNVILRNYNE